MDGVFEDVREFLTSMVDAGLKYDATYSIGMLVHIEFYLKEYTNTSHVFLINALESLQRKTSQVYEKFVVTKKFMLKFLILFRLIKLRRLKRRN